MSQYNKKNWYLRARKIFVEINTHTSPHLSLPELISTVEYTHLLKRIGNKSDIRNHSVWF